MNKLILLLTLAFTTLITNAQNKNQAYAEVDAATEKLGALTSLNVAQITDTITAAFADKELKARAIYYWITHNIAIDPRAFKNNDKKKTLPEEVILSRKTTGLGYSLLVQEMCSYVKIRCLSIDGHIKTFAEQINEPEDEVNHSWNVIQLGQSPESWYYVDACRGSGYLDEKMTVFTRNFTSEYFFADRNIFNLDHYADNSAWQLGKGPNNLKAFYSLPIISSEAYAMGLGKPIPEVGLIKTKINKPVEFSYPYNGEKIAFIKLKIGDGKRQSLTPPMNFTTDGDVIKFSYSFKEEDEFPMTVMIDDRAFISYKVEIKEK
jgi:hypothetical protein